MDKALSDIRKLGQVTAEDKSEGTVKSRQSRLSAIFNSRLTTLRKRREELLIQFLEDADPIKTIDAAIDREARAIQAVFADKRALMLRRLGEMGITAAWLPPPTKGSSTEGTGYDIVSLTVSRGLCRG